MWMDERSDTINSQHHGQRGGSSRTYASHFTCIHIHLPRLDEKLMGAGVSPRNAMALSTPALERCRVQENNKLGVEKELLLDF